VILKVLIKSNYIPKNVDDQQAKTVNLNKNTKDKPLRTNAAIWYHKARHAELNISR